MLATFSYPLVMILKMVRNTISLYTVIWHRKRLVRRCTAQHRSVC